MATKIANPVVNGNYAGHGSANDHGEPYPYAQAGPVSNQTGNVDTFGSQAVPASSGQAVNEDNEPSKDEVGWSFVKQYYKSLHSHPEKLHLFYNKKSQFVTGNEAEKVNIAVGRSAIAERFKELDFQECKVLLTNVDIQSSDSNIVLQVIGAMSNKGEPQTKFIQTFILTRQSVGYYVLNDMLRFILEESDDNDTVENAVEPPAAKPEEPKPQSLSTHSQSVDTAVDEKLKDSSETGEQGTDLHQASEEGDVKVLGAIVAESSDTNGTTSGESAPTESTPENKTLSTSVATDAPRAGENGDGALAEPKSSPSVRKAQVPAAHSTEDQAASPERAPVEPAPVPVEPKSQAPKTWANLVAASQGKPAAATATTPAIPAAAAPAQTRAAPPASPPTGQAESTTTNNPQNASGWQTAGHDHVKRQSRPQSMSGDRPNTSAYIKYVTEKVDGDELKAALESYGELQYFDISRQKNCAFAEFATIAGFNAAVAANPHRISGEQIFVEERRPRANAYGGPGFNGGRNGPNRGRGSFDARANGQNNRGGFPRDGGRGGNFNQNRGRGGNLTPRNRGPNQAVAGH